MRRRNVYKYKKYSLHVGSNQISGFRTITPEMIASSPVLQSRAAKWMRRELQAFESLKQSGPSSPSRNLDAGRLRNTEHVLKYVNEMLKHEGIKSGGLEDALETWIGRDNAQLFLHELSSWMRSPFNEVEEWDRFVQYPTKGESSSRKPTAIHSLR